VTGARGESGLAIEREGVVGLGGPYIGAGFAGGIIFTVEDKLVGGRSWMIATSGTPFGAFGFVWAMFFIETGVSALGGFGALAGARFSEAVGATVARFGADVIIAGFVGAGVTEVVGAVAVIAVVGMDGCVAVSGVIGATGPIPAAGVVGAAAVIATTGPVGVATVGAVIVGTSATSVPPADGYRAAIVSTDQVFASLQRAIRAASSTCFRHDSRTAT
jgi:hypothetical protein